MLKKSFLLVTLAVSTLGSLLTTRAEEYKKGIYGNLAIGTGTYSDIIWSDGSTDTFQFGFGFETGIGYDFGKRFRTEITYSNTSSEQKLLNS